MFFAVSWTAKILELSEMLGGELDMKLQDMSFDELVEYIESINPRLRTAESMARVYLYVKKYDGNPSTTEILENVEGATKTSIDNAIEVANLIEKSETSGGDSFFVHARKDRIFYSPNQISERDFKEMQADVAKLFDDAERDEEKRKLLADEFDSNNSMQDIEKAFIESLEQDKLGGLQKAGKVIQKIKQSDETQINDQYDILGWRTSPNKYEALERTV